MCVIIFWYYIEYGSVVNSRTETECVKDVVYEICPCQNNKSSFNILPNWLPQAKVQEWINIAALIILVGCVIYWSDIWGKQFALLRKHDSLWRLFPPLHMHTSNTPTQVNGLDIKHVMGEWIEWREDKEKDLELVWVGGEDTD